MRDIGEPNRVANQNSAAYAAEPSARRQTQSRMRGRIWLLLWSGLGILTLVLLFFFDFIRIPDPLAASLPYHNDFLSCSGYKLIGFIGSKHWFVGCFALLFVLTCAAMAATGIGVAIIPLVQLFTGFSAFTDAKSSFNEVLDLPFTPISKWPDRSFEFYAQYGYTYILFLFLGKLVSRLTQNKYAVNETLEFFVLYPGNVVLMLASPVWPRFRFCPA